MFYEKRKNDLFIATRHKNGRLQCGAHLHYHLELVWMYEGSSTAYIDAVEYPIPCDSLFLSFPNQLHSYETHGPESYMLMIVNPVVAPMLAPYFDNMLPEEPILEQVSSYPELIRLLTAIRDEEAREKDPLSSPKMHGLVLSFFAELFRHMPLRDQVQGDSGALKTVIDYCARHFDRDLSLAVLAEELHMSKYYISHLFGNHVHMKFTDYINSLRVSAACRYLTGTDKSVTEISELVGFGTCRTFDRAFLRQFGKSPSEYRAENAVSTLKGGVSHATDYPGSFLFADDDCGCS